MKKNIIVEETVKFHHEIIIEGTEEDIDAALDEAETNRVRGLDDYVDALEKHVKVISVCDDYHGGDTEDIEYYDEEDIDEI